MKILFLGIGRYNSINDRGIYLDLLRVFISKGHEVFIVSPLDAKGTDDFQMIEEPHSHILKVKTGRIQKTNLLEKGINTLLIEKRYIRAIKNHYNNVRFDLVLYPTPPITFLKVVDFIKKRDNAVSYLLLKDIFPQNAVDIGVMKKTGVKSVIYKYFRNKEKKLYAISDHIGCMSEANVKYVLAHNPDVPPEKVCVCPNSVEIEDRSVGKSSRDEIRRKYQIPADKTVFIYGGNLGKPQGIPFLIRCLEEVKNYKDAFFLVVGDGTEYKQLEDYYINSGSSNFMLLKRLPKDDYDNMVGACDVGLIFLDHRFTIPNFPSRLLSYMQSKIPVLAVTDIHSDIGSTIISGGFGWWCESNNEKNFEAIVKDICKTNISQFGDIEFEYLKNNYSVEKSYSIIMEAITC